MADVVEIILALRNVRQFVSGADQASKSIKGVGDTAEKSGKQAGTSWKGIAKWGGAAAAVVGATKFIKGAVSATEDLGKQTLALSRTTGLDTRTSAEWASVLKVRGQNVKPFQMGLIKLSRVMEQARLGEAKEIKTQRALRKEYEAVSLIGGKKAPAALAKLDAKMAANRAQGEKSRELWTRLGVSMDAIRRGNVQEVIEQTSDALSRMKNPAERAAVAQQLFSRQGRELAPILFKGSKAIREQLDTAGKYVNFQDKNAKQVAEEIQHQRELRLAYLGVQVQLGTALLPIILTITQAFVRAAQAVQPLTRNGTALKVVLGILAAAFVAYKVAMIAATIANAGFSASLLITLGWIALVIVAIAAIGVAIYLLVKHWDTVRAALIRVWEWVKRNWPLLVGMLVAPWAVAVVQIIRHWDTLKKWARGLVDFIIAQFERLLEWIKSIPGKIPGLLGKAGSVLGWAVKHRPSVGSFFGAQGGGVVPFPSRVLVGERGPELLNLPTGATITPLPNPAALATGGVFESAVIPVQVVLDRRVVAEATARYTSDKVARR